MPKRFQCSYAATAALLSTLTLSPLGTRAQDRVPILCDETADCPLGLVCETTRTVESCPTSAGAGSGAGDDGDCTVEEEPIESPSCVYAPLSCSENTECDVGEVCQALGREGECTSGPEGETVCTETYRHYCFAAREDCVETSDCEDGWRCTMLPANTLDNPPPGWEGATKICLPEGIALYFEGRVETAKSSSTSADRGARADNEAPEGTSSGACSVGALAPGARRSPYGLLLLVVGTLVVRRYRWSSCPARDPASRALRCRTRTRGHAGSTPASAHAAAAASLRWPGSA